jgi:hypothetical protein
VQVEGRLIYGGLVSQVDMSSAWILQRQDHMPETTYVLPTKTDYVFAFCVGSPFVLAIIAVVFAVLS